jgi:hypothetical protein
MDVSVRFRVFRKFHHRSFRSLHISGAFFGLAVYYPRRCGVYRKVRRKTSDLFVTLAARSAEPKHRRTAQVDFACQTAVCNSCRASSFASFLNWSDASCSLSRSMPQVVPSAEIWQIAAIFRHISVRDRFANKSFSMRVMPMVAALYPFSLC